MKTQIDAKKWEEAAKIAFAAGQIDREKNRLFSEDVY